MAGEMEARSRAVQDAPTDRSEEQAATAAGALVWWHVAWLALIAMGSGLILALPVNLEAPAMAAMAIGAAPAAAGALMARSKRRTGQRLILFNWALAGLLAAALTGGFSSPLAPWLLTPLAAAAAMGQPRRLALAAAIGAGALGLLGLCQLTMVLPQGPSLTAARALGALGLATTTAGLSVALVVLQRQVEQDALRRGVIEARLRSALADQPHLILSIWPNGKLASVWGVGPRELRGQIFVNRQITQLAGLADRAAVEEALSRAMSEGRAEVSFALAGEPEVWLELTLRRADTTRIMGVLRDARGQHAREAELIQARAEAEAQNAGKSRFLANMSHELRTPLNAIMGFSDIMRQRLFGPLSDKYGEYAELIHESGGHLLELINDVLDVSKIEAERFELRREEFDVREAANAVLRLMRGQADRAGINLRGLLPKDPLEVDADRRAIKQIALNLISNALKFTPKGGAVTLTVQAAGPVLEIVVADTGAGISAEDIQRLGRPYEQAGAADQRAVGTGLGLSLVRSFAELHGGEMVMESRLGEGTTVIVRMPVVLPAEVERA